VKCPILGFLQFFCPKNYKKIKYKKSNTKITKKSNADITSKYFYIFSCMNFCTNVCPAGTKKVRTVLAAEAQLRNYLRPYSRVRQVKNISTRLLLK
jgi:hypothetical protein